LVACPLYDTQVGNLGTRIRTARVLNNSTTVHSAAARQTGEDARSTAMAADSAQF